MQSRPQPGLDIWWRHPNFQHGAQTKGHESGSVSSSLHRLEMTFSRVICFRLFPQYLRSCAMEENTGQEWNWINFNLRSGPILADFIIHSLEQLPLKLGLIQTPSCLCSLRPDFGRNANWLLEQCHKIWLAVGNAGSWKRLFLAWLFSWMIRCWRREGSILLSFLLFYGLMVGKYASICAMEIQKIHIFDLWKY